MYSVTPQLCLATITVSIVGYPLTWMTRVLELYTIKKENNSPGLLLFLLLSSAVGLIGDNDWTQQ